MELENEHSYIKDVHLAKFKQLAGVVSDEDNDNKEVSANVNETFTLLLSP
jgi:hypothetical protein